MVFDLLQTEKEISLVFGVGVYQHIHVVGEQLQLPSCFVSLFELNNELVFLYNGTVNWNCCKQGVIRINVLRMATIMWHRTYKGYSYWKAFPKHLFNSFFPPTCQPNLGKLFCVE